MSTVTKLNIGDPMPSFRLKNLEVKEVRDSDFKNNKILVIVFASNKCPVYKDYEERLVKIQKEYADKGVQIIAVNSNAGDEESIEKMKNKAKEAGYNFPYLKDENQELAKALGAVCTPHVFVFDERRKLRYQGRIDDNRNPNMVKNQDLKNALDALLQGKEIKEAITRPFGCAIVWKY